MLLAPLPNDFAWSLANTTARPASAYGTAVIPTNTSVYASDATWYQIFSGASITEDVLFLSVCFNSASSAGVIRRIVADIGIDETGGTSYSSRTITGILAGYSTQFTAPGGGVWYDFPIRIPAGSSIAVRAVGDVASAFNVYAKLYGKPRRPELCKFGRSVRTVGGPSGSLLGTAITIGTTSKGAWVDLGTLLDGAWWFQFGYTCNDLSQSAGVIAFDVAIGDATAKDIVIEDAKVCSTTSEQISKPSLTFGCHRSSGSKFDDHLYIRGQSSTTVEAGTSVTAYAVMG